MWIQNTEGGCAFERTKNKVSSLYKHVKWNLIHMPTTNPESVLFLSATKMYSVVMESTVV